ncbi:MAG: efflux RND transporter periplasmic adaptor subunit [Anaerolineae bacterium]|nr:efflux RND transporter periplasmic adaptor subunit [Anaerolineae bacterium]
MKKAWWVIVLVLIGLGGVGYWGYVNYLQPGAAQAAAPEQVTELVLVTRGALQDSIEGSGNLAAAQEMSLAFSSSGRVAEVLVKVGDTVAEGQSLALLEPANLELAVEKANLNLAQAQIQLDQALEPATAAEIAKAEASLSAAQASYARVKEGTSEAQLAQLKGNMELAGKKVQQAQGNYDRYGERMAPSLQDATMAYEAAKLAYEIAIAGPANSSLISGWNQVEQAQASLDALRAGPDADTVTAAELKVQQAQLALNQARRNLEAATLVAPFAGVITAVNVAAGEMASGAVITLADLQTLEVEFNLDESDIPLVAVGKTARVSVSAVDETALSGTVTAIAPVATLQSGVPLYPVTVQLQQIPERVRAGMSVDVEVITEVLEDVLYLPQRAVRLDGDAAYVMQQTDSGEFVATPVTLGRSLAGSVEILSGLVEGDVVGVVTEVAAADGAAENGNGMQFPGMGALLGGKR